MTGYIIDHAYGIENNSNFVSPRPSFTIQVFK